MLVTFRVALHYVRPDNYHVFFGHVTLLLNSNSWMELDSRLVEICRDSFVLFCFVKSSQSWNRKNINC